MRANMLILKCIAIIITFCLMTVSSQTAGTLYIGRFINDTTDSYTFNKNYPDTSFYIPVYLFIGDPSDIGFGNETEFTRNVSVTCDFQILLNSLSSATFTPEVISAGDMLRDTFLNISFSGPVAGEANSVFCYAESLLPENSTEPSQFTKDSSQSIIKSFKFDQPGHVNIVNSVIFIAYTEDALIAGSFRVRLSLVPRVDVNVVCSVIPGGTGGLRMTLSTTMIVAGTREGEVDYIVSAKGDPIEIVCQVMSPATPLPQFVSSSSRGSRATVIISEGTVELRPAYTALSATEMTAFLILNKRPDLAVQFACTVYEVNSTQTADDIAKDRTCDLPSIEPRPTPSINETTVTMTSDVTVTQGNTNDVSMTITPRITMTTASPSTSTVWKLKSDLITFDVKGDLFKLVELYRSSAPPSVYTQELVVVKCCADSEVSLLNTGSPYTNQSASLFVTAYLSPPRPVNWTLATAEADRDKESDIINPAYREFGPCPCDVILNECDPHCCCDELCGANDKETFDCLPGPFGGQPRPIPARSCDYNSTHKADWESVLCVVRENNAFLGLFWYPRPAIRRQTDYDAQLGSQQNEYSFRNKENVAPEEERVPGNGYKHGLSIKMLLNNSLTLTRDHHLTLPTPTLAGQCVRAAPVRFLQDSSHTCSWSLTEAMCGSNSVLNALTYAEQCDINCQIRLGILKRQEGNEIAKTTVSYRCIENDPDRDVFMAKYVKSADRYTDRVPRDKSFLFDFGLPVNALNETDCYFEPITGGYVCGDFTPSNNTDGVEVLPEECYPVPDSPPVPYLNQTSQTCHNAVVDVRYKFIWREQEIMDLEVVVILASLPLVTERRENVTMATIEETVSGTKTVNVSLMEVVTELTTNFTQNFEVLFSHKMLPSDNDSDVTPESYLRSGNPGYDQGRPLISGISVYANSSQDVEFISVSSNSRLSLWQPGTEGLCEGAGRKDVLFGQNERTSCLLRLTFDDLLDCDNLRKLVLNRQDNLMLSSHVSMVGDPSKTSLQPNWTQIFREDISGILGNITLDETTTAFPITMDTVTMDMTTEQENTTIVDRSSELEGVCHNVPTGIAVHILYTEAGLANYNSIYRIVSAKISYTLSSWQVFCGSGLSGNSCQSSPRLTQPFELTSSVHFIKVPRQEPPSLTSYDEAKSMERGICKNDACWEEIFYPFMDINRGDDPQYTVAVGLLMLVYIIGLFFITRPVSRW